VSKRLAFLEKMTADGSKDPLAWYGLALEYSGLGRVDDALATFEKLREMNAGYVPMYLMCGTMLVKAGRVAEGKAWLGEGIDTARGKGDTHALGELQDALAQASAG
jgi:hypothetical protein